MAGRRARAGRHVLLAALAVLAANGARLAPSAAAAAFAPLGTFGTGGSGDGQIDQLSGVAVDATGKVYVGDSHAGHRVVVFNPDGSFSKNIGGGIGEAGAGQTPDPRALALGPDGNLYVDEVGDYRIDVFRTDGTFLRGFGNAVRAGDASGAGLDVCTTESGCQAGTPGSGAGEMMLTTAMAIDAAGDVFVTDPLNRRVDVFTGAGAFRFAFGANVGGSGVNSCSFSCVAGSPTAALSGFVDPEGVATSASSVFVTDNGNERVSVFSLAGAPQLVFGADVGGPGIDTCSTICNAGTSGGAGGQLNGPTGAALGSDGNLYLTDSSNFRVDVFSPAGVFLRAFGQSVVAGDDTTTGPFDVCTTAAPGCQQGGTNFATPGALVNANWITLDCLGDVYVGQNGEGLSSPTTEVQRFGENTASPPSCSAPSGGSGGGSGGGSSGGGSGSSSSPIPHLAIGQPKPGGSLVLDGSASTAGGEAISGYGFKLSSGGGEIKCGAQAPVVKASFAGPAIGTATLSVLTARGVVSTTTAPYTTTGPKLIKRARRAAVKYLAKQSLVSAQCLPAPASAPAPLTIDGKQVNASCEVHAGLVDAVGCGLRQVELCSGVPSAERRLLEAHMNQYAGCFVRREVLGAFGASARQASGKVGEQCAFHCVPVVDTYYVSREPIRVNGVDMAPRPGAAIVLAAGGLYSTQFAAKHADYLVSSSADVLLEQVPLQLDSRFDYAVGPSETSAHLADFDIKHPVPFLPEFSDLPITGTLSADLVPGGATQIAANVSLPEVFTDDEGNGLTTSLTLRTDNANGLYLNSFHLSIPNADLGEVAVEKAELDYSRAAATLEGHASVVLPSGDTAFAEVGFLRGDFNKFRFDYAFGPGEGIEVFDGIYLTELFGALTVNPTELEGGSRVSIGPSVTDQGCGVVDVRGKLTIHFGPLPFSIGGTGTNELLCQEVGTRHFHVDSDGHAEIGESVGFEIPSPDTGDEPPLARVKGELNGQAYVDAKSKKFHFQFDGVEQASFDLFGVKEEASAELVVSDLGFGLCADLHGWHPGFGEDWNKVNPLVLVAPPPVALPLMVENLDFQTDSCNIAQYRTLPGGAGAGAAAAGVAASVARNAARGGVGAAHAAGAYSFTVPRGQRTAIVVLRGTAGAPDAILHGPGGRTIDATSTAPTIDSAELVLHAPSERLTEIQIRGRNAGGWTIEPAPGSPAIASVAVSHELPPPRITAHVSGRGARRVLHYRAQVAPGTRITFLERGNGGSTAIGSTTRARGQIAFVPSSAKAGRRTITAALVSAAGTPEPSLKVTTYVASPPAPGRPGRVRVRRTRSALQISFSPAALAKRQIVTLRLSDGRRLMFVLKGSRHRLAVRGVSRRVRVLSLRVRGEGFGRLGPVAKL